MPQQDSRMANQRETRKLQLTFVFMIIFYTFTKVSFIELLAIVIFGQDFRIVPGDVLANPPVHSPTAWILGFLSLAVLTCGLSITFQKWRQDVYPRPSLIFDTITSVLAISLAAIFLLGVRPVPPGEFVSRVARLWWQSEEIGGRG
jgi:hypothetical protein